MSEGILEKLTLASIERQKEWCPNGPTSILFKATELAGETGELCNIIKKISREEIGIVGSRSNLDAAADEIADVIICVDLIATHLGINLDEAISRKFNKTSEKYGLKTKINSLQSTLKELHWAILNSGQYTIEKTLNGCYYSEQFKFKVFIKNNHININIYDLSPEVCFASERFTSENPISEMLGYINSFKNPDYYLPAF